MEEKNKPCPCPKTECKNNASCLPCREKHEAAGNLPFCMRGEIIQNSKIKNKQVFKKADIEKLHTTPLGVERIKRNLNLEVCDVVAWCKDMILSADKLTQEGKNWYAYTGDVIITINTKSYTIITAHRTKELT